MLKQTLKLVGTIFVLATLFACQGEKETGEKLELEVQARLDGKPVEQAKVTVDGKEQGRTDAKGYFSKVIRKKGGAEVQVTVSKELPGYTIMPWKGAFVVKLPKEGVVDKYSFTADLKASQLISIVVTDQGKPVGDASIAVGGKEVGKTDASGAFIYEYEAMPKGGFAITVSKAGFGSWQKTAKVEPGQKLEVALSKRTALVVGCFTDEYGRAKPVPGVTVSVNGKELGKTNASGKFSKTYEVATGKKARVTLSAPGYIPASWEKTVVLQGEVDIQHYFYPATPKPIRTGIYAFGSNTPGADLKEMLDRTEDALRGQLFKYSGFREVPTKTLHAEMKHARIGVDKLTSKGWQNSPLIRTVDMVVIGSVAKDDKGFLIETKFYTSSGKLILSQLSRAKSAGDANSDAKDIVASVIERFPFEGTVVGSEDDRFRINLGKSAYRIGKGMEFDVKTPKFDEAGKVTGYRTVGNAKVKKVDDTSALVAVEDLKKGEKVAIGDRVTRYVPREGDGDKERNYFVLSAKGGVPPDVSPLAGVNIYLNNDWIASTGADGKVEVPIRVGKNYSMVLYRHGYQQISDKFRVDKNGETKEFALTVNNSIFKVESQPAGASVYVDGDSFGKTPISGGKPVTLGFHTVRLTFGENYRDWEEVVEFDKKVEDRTGDKRIVLHKDYLKLAEKALAKGDVNGAIQAYSSTQKGHPDYSEAHHLLAQLYLDEQGDYDSAIREFENVLTLPENQQLVYKQFSVAYTNLGHAYYEKGNALVHKDKDAAAKYFGMAIKNLKIAKQNTRFFPTQKYDEAVHDTYYYMALSYHKLYLLTKKNNVQNDANLAWREYFDFFPKALEGNSTFEQNRDAAQKYWDQIKEQ